MTTPVIIDAIAVILLAVFVIRGAKLGLLRALGGLVSVIAALIGAKIAAVRLTPLAVDLASPAIESRLTHQIENARSASGLTDVLDGLNLSPHTLEVLQTHFSSPANADGSALTDALLPYVTDKLAHTVIYGLIYILAFLIILLVLKLLLHLLGLVAKLPVIHEANALGGAALGAAEYLLLMLLAVWLLRTMGTALDVPPWSDTRLLRIFTAGISLLS